jgi:hypothetical protein
MRSTTRAIAVWERRSVRWGLQGCWQLTGAGPLASSRRCAPLGCGRDLDLGVGKGLVAGSGMRRSPTGATVRPMSDLPGGSSFADDDQVFSRGVDGMHGRIERGDACRHAHVVATCSRGEKCAHALMCRRTCRVRACVLSSVRAT